MKIQQVVRVAAVAAALCVGLRSAVALLGELPFAPSHLEAADSGLSTALIAWRDNSKNEEFFRVERSPSFPGGYVLLPANTVFFEDRSGPGWFQYRVRAENGAGASAYSPIAVVQVLARPPAPPKGVTATEAGDQHRVVVRWIDESENEARFRIERQKQGVTGAWVVAHSAYVAANSTSYTDSPDPGTFRYRVVAVGGAGEGESGWVSVTVQGRLSVSVPVITVLPSLPPRMAPHTVFVHATDSVLGDPAFRWQRCRFEWDFGDSGPGVQTTTDPRTGAVVDLSREQQGFNAAYVYDRPGTYVITLRLTDETGASRSTQTQVTILPDTRSVRYVDAEGGNDQNDGTTPERAWATAGTAISRVTDNMTLRFKKGCTFDVPSNMNIGARTNVVITGYGDGAAPTLTWTAGQSGSPILSVSTYADGVLVDGLRFDTTTDGIGIGGTASGRSVTWRSCAFGHFTRWIAATGVPVTGLLCQNISGGRCVGHHFTTTGGEDLVYLGCRTLRSDTEHPIRILPKGNVSARNVAFSFGLLDQEGWDGKGPLRYQAVQYGSVYRTVLLNGETQIGHNGSNTDYIRFDTNMLTDYAGGNAMVIQFNAKNMCIVNNQFVTSHNYRMAICCRGGAPFDGTNAIEHVDIFGNKFTAEPRMNDAPMINTNLPDIPVRDISIEDNEFRSPVSFGARFMLVRHADDITESSRNTFTDLGPQYHYVQISDLGMLDWDAWISLPFVRDDRLVP